MFKIGDIVEAVDQTNGWGNVSEGDIGEVVRILPTTGLIIANFPAQRNWRGYGKCFRLIDEQLEND